MTERAPSHSSGGSRAGTSKNALLSSSSDDAADKWTQATVSFDFDKMHADDFPNFLNDEFSIHKNDEALLADFTALLEDGDDAIMTSANSTINVSDDKSKEKEKETNKNDANVSTSTSVSLNSSVGEILVTTDTRQSQSEQHSQSIGSIMSDHDYLSRADILEITDEENFFSQGFPKPMKVENDSMDVNLSGTVPPTLMSQPLAESPDSAAVATANSANEANLPTMAANVADDIAKSIFGDEVMPLLVKLTATKPAETENLMGTMNELEAKMSKWKDSVSRASGSSDVPSSTGKTTTSDQSNEGEKPDEATVSECDSDPVFMSDRSEPLEYHGTAKAHSGTTTDESDDEFVSRLKAELNTADALTDELHLTINSFRRKIAPSTAQPISIKLATHLERMSADLLKIAAKFKSTSAGCHLNGPTSNTTEKHVTMTESNKLNETSKEQLMADFSSSSEANSSSDDGNGVPRVRRKKKSRGNKLDPSLSQINGIDDEDNILVKNEPMLDSQLLNGDADAASKAVNVIEELNKWTKDYDNEGEFYGFDATDTDDCANSSIEIGVKTEPANNSEIERRLDESQATQMYSVSDEIAKANAIEASRSSGSTVESTKTSDEARSVESTKEIAEAAPVVNNVADDVKKGEADIVHSQGLLQNGNDDSSSENDASDEMDDDEEDDDIDADADNDREIARLLDFSSLGVKRKISSTISSAASKVNGTEEPKKKQMKKQKPKDGLDAILRQSQDASDDSDDGASSKSEDDKITEEQYLKEHNLSLKNQLLADTSSEESDFDSETDQGDDSDRPKTNGTHKKGVNSDDETDDENSNVSGSYESLVDQFLKKDATENESTEQKSTKISQRKSSSGSEADKSDLSSSSKLTEPKSSPEVNGSREVAKENSATAKATSVVSSSEKEAENGDKEDNESVDQSSESTDTPKRKTKVVGKMFKALDKDLRPLMSSDDSDDNDSNKSKKKASSDENSDCEMILDTTLFKDRKKEIDSKQLSKILNSSAKAKATTSRATPDDCISLSSDDELEPISVEKGDDKEASDDDEEGQKNRTGRKLLRTDQLAGETKRAQREETLRVQRLKEKQTRLTQIIESQRQQSQSQRSTQDKNDTEVEIEDIILDYDSKKKENIIVHRDIQKHLKSHQIDGIKFMYDCCYGSVDSLKDHPGSGCVLAHCMGLGKTLQLISLLHTVITYPQLKTNKVLVICPKSTVLNWKEEIERWMGPIREGRRLKLFQFADQSGIQEKLGILKEWSGCGKASSKAGCLLLGYEAFRTLVFYHTQKKAVQLFTPADLKKIEDRVYDSLLKRGATDLVICDEGHMIKNQKSTTSLAVNKIETDRRIILTGTPIQNNLKEYYSMVNFIKPSFLGTEKEFNNLYANPIKSGQHKDSSKQEIKVMKQRSYVLHNKLSKFVQRREAALLKTFLPEKYEYVLFIPMTDVQNQLYEYFLENNPLKDKLGGKSLISDYTILRKIWTHPKVLENAYLNALKEENRKREKQRRMNNEEDEDDRPDDFLDSQEGKMSVKNDWWRQHVEDEHLKTILPSNKLKILFEILKKCEENGEKCLIFSAFVAVLDVVEFFMREITRQTQEGTATSSGLENFRGTWKLGDDYYRLDGKTPKSMRHQMITNFNDPKNARARVFLISAKAGGQGINLIGANRVILLDTSWNPSNDQQNIFRVFRLGQKKICYIYRLLAMGTMEEKVYSRSVTKQAMSCRVVDEQQIDRHYNMAELTELYTLVKPDYSERPTPSLPSDKLLAHLLHKFPNMVYKYHEHDSLLERKDEQDLSEAEKADAWAAYENDAKMRNTLSNMGTYNPNFNMVPGAYDTNFGSYGNSLYGSTFGGSGYSASMAAAYLNQFSSTAFPGPEYQELMRMYSDTYPNPYANYSSLYGGNTSAAASLFNSGMMTSPPPPPATPSSTSPSSSLLAYNRHPDTMSAANYNAVANTYLSSLVNPSSTSKGYSNSMFNNSAMQMLLNSYPASNSGGGRIPAPVSSPLTSTSKSPATTASSLLDPSIYAYMQQNNLFLGGNNTTTTTASSASPSTSSLANAISGAGSSASSTSSRQGPNAKRNPMLSKELSMMSGRTPFFDSLNLPSIQTSVITKSPVNLASSTANSSNSTPSPAGDRLVSPEPHLTVKNVSTINQTVTKSTTPPNKGGNNGLSPSGAQMLNKNSVSITSINKKPNAETSSITSGSSIASSNQQSSSSGSSTTSSSTTTGGNSSGVVINSTVNSTSSRSTSALTANPSSRGITNMGISYPDKERVIETTRDSPTPKAVNMGIVYPMNRPTNQKPSPMNSKNLATSTSRSTPLDPPMTQLAAVNKVLQQQNMRRTSPNTAQPGTSKPSAQSTPSTSITSSPTFPRKMMNTSVTFTPVRSAAGAGPTTNSPTSKPTTGMSLNKRPFNVSTTSKTNLSSSVTLSPIPPTASGPQYKTFSRSTPEKDGGGKNNPSKVVFSKTNPTWQTRNQSMTITPAQTANHSATTSNGMTIIPRSITVTTKANPSNQQQQQQQRSSPVIVRNSPNTNQSINNNRGVPSPTTIRRTIIGAKTNPPQTAKPATTIPMNVQSTVPRPIVSSKAGTVPVNKLPTLRNEMSVQNNLANRKRTASPRPANANMIVPNQGLSISESKKPKLSLASSNSRPSPIVRTIAGPLKPAVGTFQNMRIKPRPPNNTNNSQTDNSQRNVQDISTLEIVELD